MDSVFTKKLYKKIQSPKIDGITKRWLILIIGLIVLMFFLAFVVCTITIKGYYYNSVESIVRAGVSDSAISYFSNKLENGNSIETSATEFADSYSHKDTTTLWIINNDGDVVLSTNGFAIKKQVMPDYDQALATNGEGKYIGKLENNQKVMAITRLITNRDGVEIGALRVMTALNDVDAQIITICFILGLAFIFVLAIIILSNFYFIRTIIIPVKEVNNATKLIAQGNLDVRIEKQYNDEIGDLADSINTMASEISAADKMKNDFISTISHELRTPLTSIKGWGETLTLGNQDNVDELTKKGLQVIVSEAGRLEGFVEELLDFSRLQSGRMQLRLAKTDILAELEETLFTFRERAIREGYEVRYSVPDVPSVANADANRLKQVFMNILDNALKYSRPGSKIFVKAEFVKVDGDDYVQIAIADQGCGISAEDLPHVKEKFYKANMSVRGSGIGLAVTSEIINLHNGFLDIDSVEGTGTLVTIKLPLAAPPETNDNN
ncbi:MAG: HAMP domain-containing sensor histidine kinase [Eubacteriales bacterium]|nr:HAMP domain-containing sensor histidine kinase [Eubacteriales bacterium]